MNNYHLVPDGDRWRIIGEGSERSILDFASREEAVERCSQLMQNQQGSLKIHNEDGTIEEERNYPLTADPVESEG